MSDLLDDLVDMFPDVVLVRAPNPPDAFGAETGVLPAPIPRKAYVYGRIRLVAGEDGKMKQSTVTAVLHGFFGVSVYHEYTLPVRFSPQKPKPIAVAKRTDEHGQHHETVFFE